MIRHTQWAQLLGWARCLPLLGDWMHDARRRVRWPAGSSAPTSGYTGAAQGVNNGGGMVYLRNRWYDPQTGRFLTQDPIGLAGGVNLYAYAGNDPISFSDPFGLCKRPDDPACKLEGLALRGPTGTPGPGAALGTLLPVIGAAVKPVTDRIVVGTSATALVGGGCSTTISAGGGCSAPSVQLNTPSAGGSLDLGFKFRDGSKDKVHGSISIGGRHMGATLTNETFTINLGWNSPTVLPVTISVDVPPDPLPPRWNIGIRAQADATAVAPVTE